MLRVCLARAAGTGLLRAVQLCYLQVSYGLSGHDRIARERLAPYPCDCEVGTAWHISNVPECDDSIKIMIDFRGLPAGLPMPLDDGAADHLVGRPVPHLDLPSTTGESVALHELGAGRTILYLYPLTGRPDVDLPDGWDNIPGARGCTGEACDFRDHHVDLLDAGASKVFGASSQDRDYQREVVERLRLPFTMLSDTDLHLAEQLNLPTFRVGELTLFKRLTLVIRDGMIEHVFYPIFPPNEHAREVLIWLQSRPATPGG